MSYTQKSHLTESIKKNRKCSINCYGPVKEGFKICSKCRVEKPIEGFGISKRGVDGLNPKCKICYREHINNWRIKNPEKQKKAEKRQRENPHILKYRKQWVHDHREELNRLSREWCKEHPESRKITLKIYNRKRRALKQQVNENYTLEDEQITFQVFGNQCFNCGKTPKRLTIDHHIALSKLAPLTVDNAVPLCRSCNSSKWKKDPKDFYSSEQLNQIEELFKIALKLKSGMR